MKKQLLSAGLFLLICSGNLSYAQDYVQKKITNENGNISLVTFKEDSNFSSSSVKNIFNEVLKLSKDNELRLYNSEIDDTHQLRVEKYQQYYKGIFVEFSGYNVQFKNGKIISMSGGIFQADGANTHPGISASTAFDAAVKNVNAQKYMWENSKYLSQSDYKKPKGDLVLLPIQLADGTDQLTLAYRFDIYAQEPISREFVYVDAMSGNVIMSNPIMMHSTRAEAYYQRMIEEKIKQPTVASKPVQQNFVLADGTADTRYSGTQQIKTKFSGALNKFILYDDTRGGGIKTYNLKKGTDISTAVDFADIDNNWTDAEFNNANFDNAALDAHWGVEKTYDYFKSKFNRNSYNNAGGVLKSYVHYGDKIDNAYWTGNEMLYGDGKTKFNPLTALDITAHELGHGVCSTSAALAYQRESGAMNEGFSDIWGAAAEYAYAPTKQTWLIGEDITKVNPGYLRSLSNPKSGLTAQPDTYHGANWYPATVTEGCATPDSNTNDYCGVHTNSGILNHWFYILSIGKFGINDLGNSYYVKGITIQKAEQIAYKLETFYLTANSTFMDARNYGIQAATTLYGANSPEMIATQNAFYAVGLGTRLNTDTTPPTIPTNLTAYNTTGTTTFLKWKSSIDVSGISSYIIFKDGVQVGSAPGSVITYQVKGLTPNTTYTFRVKAKDYFDNISGYSDPLSVKTLNTPPYCIPNMNANIEQIKRVVFNTIDNTSTSKDGYEDFSYISTDVNKGSTYTISITPDTGKSINSSENYIVFIDYNNDGVFSGEIERVFTQGLTNISPVTGSFTIPTTVSTTGPVRMRVVMGYGYPNSVSCEDYTMGQTEDYTLNLKSALATANANNVETVIYPNPVKDYMGVQSKKSGEYQYKIFTSDGRAIAEGVSSNKKINTQNLLKGIYIVEIKFQDGEKKTQKFIKE